ncbi:MAG: outer membrane beta-barrel protein [Prevotellaceae bacterium]|nr:outer membrane beta-barrel protein [Prevotellaceae bacterium]
MKRTESLLGLRRTLVLTQACAMACAANAGIVRGVIKDSENGEPLVGAVVVAVETGKGTAADAEGNYKLELAEGVYTLRANYIGYETVSKDSVEVPAEGEVTLDFPLAGERKTLGEVSVTAVARRNTETAQIQEQKRSLLVQTGVSAQQIARTQDKDASEVIRRVPGVSVIDDRFVMVRGLSQRYNNVWLNGGAVPSSEADTRAFSFDVLPSSQLDNIVIVKSPAPEYPADFTGGFILVNTRQLPDESGLNVSVGLGANDRTHFRSFTSASRSGGVDWLGFGAKRRSLRAGMEGELNAYPGYEDAGNPRLDLLGNGLNNDWTLRRKRPLSDLKLNVSYNKSWKTDAGRAYGLLASLNYSDTYKTLLNMENSLYGPYDTANDKPVALRKATDNQYSNDIRLGAMLNLTLRPRADRHRLEWKSVFNQIAKDRYADRTGVNAQPDDINDMEYYYASRSTYNTQLTGKHILGETKADWSVGYAYANHNMPDRRLIERTDRTEQTMGIYRISREYTRIDEHIVSAGGNCTKDFHRGDFNPTLKAGAYGEYRARSYRMREFQYAWQPDNTLPEGFMYSEDIPGEVLIDSNYAPDKLYLYEEVNYLNNYKGEQAQLAGYLGVNLPLKAFNAYVGARYEHNSQILRMNTRQYEQSLQSTSYNTSDIFPSANLTYKLDDKNQLRCAYGRSVNRPEFRELSTSVFYDFDLGSNVMGNYDLQPAYIDNLDLRYEWYPSAGEQVSVALFYKHFRHPIEWTYTVSGGTDLVYSYVNARGANNYGMEIDIRKRLDFIGLKDFSLSFNGAFIKSKVQFDPGTNNIDRPMQGQSPYLINAGIFYNNEKRGWSAAVLYNRIGKRIIGVGNRYGTSADGTSRNIPNSYEMPRNSIDLSAAKRIGHWEIKVAVRDLLAERCLFKQYEEVTASGGQRTVEEVTRSYCPGRNFNLTIGYGF